MVEADTIRNIGPSFTFYRYRVDSRLIPEMYDDVQ